jgi:Sec-independent protein secretion pathway component TatC
MEAGFMGDNSEIGNGAIAESAAPVNSNDTSFDALDTPTGSRRNSTATIAKADDDAADEFEAVMLEALASPRGLLVQSMGSHFRARAGFLGAAFLVGIIIGYPAAGWAIEWLLQAEGMRPEGVKIVVLHPLEAVILRLKIASQIGTMLAFSVLLVDLIVYAQRNPNQVRQVKQATRGMISDAQIEWTPKQSAVTFLSLFSAGLLGALGVFYSMRILIPLLLAYLTADAQSAGLETTWQLQAWIGFVSGIVMASAIGFQTPLATLLAIRSGAVEREMLSFHRRHLWFGAVCISAFLSPPDPLSLLLVATPIIILFELAMILDRLLPAS